MFLDVFKHLENLAPMGGIVDVLAHARESVTGGPELGHIVCVVFIRPDFCPGADAGHCPDGVSIRAVEIYTTGCKRLVFR